MAPGHGDIPRTPGRTAAIRGRAGYIHCGPCGAGHFVKMVHNGIEYGLMEAYAEGFDILKGRPRRSFPRTSASTSISPKSPRSGGAAASSHPGCLI